MRTIRGRRIEPWALCSVLALGVVAAGVLGATESESQSGPEHCASQSQGWCQITSESMSEPYLPIGVFSGTPTELTITTTGKNLGQWTIKATTDGNPLATYTMPKNGSWVTPDEFIPIPGQTFPGFVIVTNGGGGTGESLGFFVLQGHRILPMTVIAGHPWFRSPFELGYSAGFGLGVSCSWQGGFAIIQSSFDANTNEPFSAPVQVQRQIYRLVGSHDLVEQSLPSITESQADAYQNSRLNC